MKYRELCKSIGLGFVASILSFTPFSAVLAQVHQGQQEPSNNSSFYKKGTSQAEFQKERAKWSAQANNGTVTIITKPLGCTCVEIASDMSHVLNELGKLRVLPIIGHGSIQGTTDILYLKGVDLSIVQSDVLEYMKRNKMHNNIAERIRYIAQLYQSELHLVAHKDIKTLQDLNGKKVSYDKKGRGADISAQTVFDSIGIKVEPVFIERDVALEMVAKGELAAAFVTTGKPAQSMKKIKAETGLHFLPIEFSAELAKTYLPAELTHEDYPDLIPAGQTIPTIGISEVLAVFNWEKGSERYKKTEQFIDAFFDNFPKFLEPVRHPKWRQVNLAADVPGWKRFPAAEEKLKSMQAGEKTKQDYFFKFLSSVNKDEKMTENKKMELYKKYTEWLKQNQ